MPTKNLPDGRYALVSANIDEHSEQYPWYVETATIRNGEVIWPGSCNSLWVVGKHGSEIDKVYAAMPKKFLDKLKQALLAQNDVELVPEQVAA